MMRILLIACLCSIALPVNACRLEAAERVELADDLTMFYRVKTPTLAIARHFAMLFRFCRDQQNVRVEQFRLNALMPAHRHGMNYRARVITQDDGTIETTGLLFHMPGHWQVIVDYEFDSENRQVKLDYYL